MGGFPIRAADGQLEPAVRETLSMLSLAPEGLAMAGAGGANALDVQGVANRVVRCADDVGATAVTRAQPASRSAAVVDHAGNLIR